MEPNSQECLPLGLATGYWDGLSGDRMRRGTIRLQTLNYQLNHFSVKRSSLLFDVNHTPQRETKLNVAEMAAQRRGLCFRLPVVESSTYCALLHLGTARSSFTDAQTVLRNLLDRQSLCRLGVLVNPMDIRQFFLGP
ncbi:hypothetical protein E4U15_003987 [Claviceps sp. LM218 group G6]|nr:hypothetical protein E4U15_003987 [Claviceps sp. LM218 group G6]